MWNLITEGWLNENLKKLLFAKYKACSKFGTDISDNRLHNFCHNSVYSRNISQAILQLK